MPIGERAVGQVVVGIADLKKHLDFLVPEEPGKPGLKKEVMPMRIVGDFRQALHDLLDTFLKRCCGALTSAFSRAEFLSADQPPVRPEPVAHVTRPSLQWL